MGDLIVNGIKWSFIIGISLIFMTALSNLLSLISMVVFNNVIGEVLHVISCCLPFDAAAVFGSIQTALTGILTFMIANKIYNLSGKRVTIQL